MKDFLTGVLLILLVIKYVVDWGVEMVEEIGDFIMKPVNRLIKCLSLATGINTGEE